MDIAIKTKILNTSYQNTDDQIELLGCLSVASVFEGGIIEWGDKCMVRECITWGVATNAMVLGITFVGLPKLLTEFTPSNDHQ